MPSNSLAASDSSRRVQKLNARVLVSRRLRFIGHRCPSQVRKKKLVHSPQTLRSSVLRGSLPTSTTPKGCVEKLGRGLLTWGMIEQVERTQAGIGTEFFQLILRHL